MPSLSAAQRMAVAAVVERYFVDGGYTLRQKYRAHSPESAQVSVLEIPKTSERKVRRAQLLVAVKDSGVIELTHEEWFSINTPFGAGSHLPGDLLATTRPHLIARIREELGVSVDLRLARRSYY